LENYIVDKRCRLQQGMTIGAVGYSTNFEPCSSLQIGFIKILNNCVETKKKRKSKENKPPFMFLFRANKKKFAVSVFRLPFSVSSAFHLWFQKRGDKDTWRHGDEDMGKWRHGHKETRRYGDLETWDLETRRWRHQTENRSPGDFLKAFTV
jgi:hypothetical protein